MTLPAFVVAVLLVEGRYALLALSVPDCRLLWTTAEHRDGSDRLRELHVFEADLSGVWNRHDVREGQGAGVFDADALPEPVVPSARAIIARHRATISR